MPLRIAPADFWIRPLFFGTRFAHAPGEIRKFRKFGNSGPEIRDGYPFPLLWARLSGSMQPCLGRRASSFRTAPITNLRRGLPPSPRLRRTGRRTSRRTGRRTGRLGRRRAASRLGSDALIAKLESLLHRRLRPRRRSRPRKRNEENSNRPILLARPGRFE